VRQAEFAQKWHLLSLHASERSAYQEHWRDLCSLVGQPTPSSDLTGQDYAFERYVKKAGTGEAGYADVFKRGRFIAEYKARGKSLGKALQQALLYARELDNPPLLVVSDLATIEIHTNFTGSSPRRIPITLDDIATDALVSADLTALQALRALFDEPARLDPRQLRERVTQHATEQIGWVAQALMARGLPKRQAAHFLMRMVFAMFAEDVGLLERGILERLLQTATTYPEQSQLLFGQLFGAMRGGGFFGATPIRHFNGGLFDREDALLLTRQEIQALHQASQLDWSEVEPAIFGTLFEHSLDETTRSRRGAHFTGVADILRIVEPVILADLRREWTGVKSEVEQLTQGKRGQKSAIGQLQTFQARLGRVTVLDPACGSGNFLVVALGLLLDLEHEVRATAFALGAGDFDMPPQVHPRQMLGIEIEAFAHELATVSVWIAFFQWNAAHGGEWGTPVLQRLDTIRHADALLNDDGSERVWPTAEFIVGNPPFLGEKKHRSVLGAEYIRHLRTTYQGRVPAGADLVTYWIEKARARIEVGATRRAGLVTTNSVRQPKSLPVMDRVTQTGAFFDAWPDLPWLQDGAAVRVSLLSFDNGTETERHVHTLVQEGSPQQRVATVIVPVIHADLSVGLNLNLARTLADNVGKSFQGVKLVGPFDLPGPQARSLLDLPNPGGKQNNDVIKPYLDGDDITRRNKDRWVIDFGLMDQVEAEGYVEPFAIVERVVKPVRANTRRESTRLRWWRYGEARPAMRAALGTLSRYIVTSEVAKHRLFAWASTTTVPSGSLVVIAADDDFTFGVLSSKIHLAWASSQGQSLEDRPRYTPSTCFETFPFPHPDLPAAKEVGKWAEYVVKVREHLLSQDTEATLTGLYNEVVRLEDPIVPGHPVSSLVTAHEHLDRAVARAYGWEWPLAVDEVLARLMALNLEQGARGHVEGR